MTEKRGFSGQNRILLFLITFVCVFALAILAWGVKKEGIESRERTIQLADSPVRVVLKGNQTYRISMDGKNFSRELPQRHKIRLSRGEFDPLTHPPQLTKLSTAQALKGDMLYIVQCVTQAIPAFQEKIAASGGEISGALPDHALMVAMSADTARVVKQMPFVRWVGIYPPAYKLGPDVENRLSRTSDSAFIHYSIYLTKKNKKNEVAKFIESIGGQVLLKPKSRRMEASLTVDQMNQVAALATVQAIDLWTPIEDDMNIVRATSGGDYLESVRGYSGQGVRAEVCDGGLRTTHVDFQYNSPIIHAGNSSSTSHGTPVYGIVFGSGAGDGDARGLLPDAQQPIFAAYGQFSDRYTHTEQLVNPSGSYRAVFQTNSWGNTRTYYYTTISAEMDEIIFDLDFLILQSQSNAGDQDSRPQAWAKNVLSVGGLRHYNTLDRGDDCWCSSASIGPADDGRIKPDLWHFYDYTLAPSSSSDTSYTNFGGTSGATPITAGHMGLLFQMWADGIFNGGPGQGRDVFNSRPHATTAKALLIHSAYQYSFSGTSHDKTRMHQGWGMPDVQNLHDMAQAHGWGFPVLIDESAVLAPLQTHTYNVDANGSDPLRATLVYADPPGVPGASVHRINDLSLKVTSPGGTVYWGNNGLNTGLWSSSGGSSNTIDTVENVFIQNPQSGAWTIQVLGDEIVQDGHVETGAIDADYALIVSGGGSGTPQPPVADFTASATSIFAGQNVTFTDTSTNGPTSWSWTFEGGSPASSTSQNPVVTYNNVGAFDVSLTATNAEGSDTETKTNYITVAAQATTVGNTTVFGSTSTSVNRRAMPFTMPEDGAIDSVTMYHAGGSGNMILAVYDGEGSPQNQLAATPSTPLNGSAGWQTINLTGSAFVAEGDTVWLAWVFESNPGIAYQTGSPGRVDAGVGWSGGMPDPYGSGTQADFLYSIYADYTPGGGPVQYTLTTNTVGQGSITLNPSGGTYNQGTVVTLTAQPGSGWQFSSWSGDLTGSQNPDTITMNSNKTVTATFTEITGSGTMGHTTVFGSSTTTANRRAMPFTMPENGTISSVTMYHTGGSGDMILAVYEGAGSPQARLGITPETAVSGSTGWQTIDLTSSVYVPGGTTIWLCWVYETNPGIYYQAGTPGRVDAGEAWTGNMPDPFGTSTQADYIYSIYADYTPGGGPAQSNVGYTNLFTSSTTSANRRAMPFTMPENGTIRSVTMYHTGGSGNMILAVYDGTSAPQNRIAVTATTAVSADNGWQTIHLATPVSVQGGTTVWLAWVYESNPGISYDSGTPGRVDAGIAWSGGMPDPFGSSTQADFLYSIFASYTID
jgi:PKD repeat protein